MMIFVAYGIAAFFCIFGFICLLHTVWNIFLSRESQPLYILIPCDQNTENVELKIKAAEALLNRAGGKRNNRLIVLDNGMSEMTREIVFRAAEQNEKVLMMRANELQNLR